MVTTSNSSNKSRRGQLAARNMSVKTIINQWNTIMPKQDLITLLLTIELALNRMYSGGCDSCIQENCKDKLLIQDV